MRLYTLALFSISCLPVAAQTSAGTIQATGTYSVNATPDQAQLTVSVITEALTAQQADQQNAVLAQAVIDALNSTLGKSGSVKTVGYSIYPRYSSGMNPSIIGYAATNSLQVTTTDLSLPGKLIDAANQAGANSVSGLSFGVQNPEPLRQQALTGAAKQALDHAKAIAAGLGVKTGAVTAAAEGSVVTPTVNTLSGTGTSTPIVTGTVGVSATVTISVLITQ